MLTAWLKDLQIAARVLRRSPGFAIVSILTVGIAIGANAAIFSVVNGVILRPLPYTQPENLYTFSLDATKGGVPEMPLSPAGYWHFHNKNHSFEDMGSYVTQVQPLIVEGNEPEQIDIAAVSASVFTTLKVSPLMGRLFTPDEDRPNGPQLAILSYNLWRTRFGGQQSVLGRTITLNGVPREVIGVMPRGFAFPDPRTAVWFALRLDPATQQFGGHFLTPIIRLKPGASAVGALADIKALIPRLSEVGYGPQWFGNVFSGNAKVVSLRESIVGNSQRPLLIVFGALAVVFLIACSNIANLFLVRTKTRNRETAVRLAMGATRRQLIRYTMAESSIIAIASGLLGVLLAYGGTRTLLALQPTAIPRLQEVGLNGTVLLFIAAITILASAMLGVLPAIRAAGVQVSAALRDGGRSATAGRESQATRALLVVTQVAMAVILLVGAGLMVRTAQALRRVDPGFDPGGVLTFNIALPPASYRPGDATAAFFASLLESIKAMPGVEAAGGIDALPLSQSGAFLAVNIEDHPVGPNDFPPVFQVRRVTPGYFETMKIPVKEGRVFDASDHEARLGTVVVSSGLASHYWPGASALGRRIAPSTPAFEKIVGVVGEVRQQSLSKPTDQTIYLPMVDSVGGGVVRMSIVVRTSGDPLRLVPAIRAEVNRRDPKLPIIGMQRLQDAVADSMADTTFTMLLLAIAAGIALVLGSVGIYGLIAFIVGERTAEIGTRLSLGAEPLAVMRLFLGQAWALTGIGIGIGLGVSVVSTRLLGRLLYGINAFDPITWVLAPLVFLAVSTVACLIPASRAAAVDPAIALRRS